jgi:hypothetical protein
MEPGTRAPKKHKAGRTSDWLNWVLVPAAIALALLSFALSWQNSKLAAQLQKQEHLAHAYIKEREKTKKLLSVLASPDTLTVKLAGTSGAPNASGVVKYNGRTGTVVWSANLPPLASDKVYQLWLIPVNGAPINAGVFGMSDDGHGRMVTAGSARKHSGEGICSDDRAGRRRSAADRAEGIAGSELRLHTQTTWGWGRWRDARRTSKVGSRREGTESKCKVHLPLAG